MTRKQCAKCPWKVSTNAHDIPGEYSVDKHCKLDKTIATDASPFMPDKLHIMACHETPEGNEKACVGWLVNQLGPGNNLALRMHVAFGKLDADVKTVGPQHERFEDTIPKQRTRKARR